MKRNIIFALLATVVISNSLAAHGGGGWGGFGAGVATGALVGVAATSASQPRDPYYYADKRNARIDSYQRQIDDLQRRLERTNDPREQDRLQSQINRLQDRIDRM
jgi:TolA-binding protein